MSITNRTATAAVFKTPGQPLETRSFELPDLAEGEAIVEVDCCTLCGSDLHSISGKRKVETPIILGHEILGRLVEVTEGLCDVNGNPLIVGERVSWSIVVSCNQCFYCNNGLPQKCEQLFKYGHQPIDRQHPLSGGLATHCHLARGTQIIKVPDQLPDFVACPANCATATVAGALRIAGDPAGKTVVIFGAGMLGLTAAAMAQHQRAKHIIIADLNRERAELGYQFGATHTDLTDLSGLTEGRGADLVLDMSGSSEAIENGLQCLRIGGRLILVGSVFPSRSVPLHSEQIVRRMIRIEGIHNYTPVDLANAFKFLGETGEQFPFQQLVEREYALTDVNRAIIDSQNNRFIRVAMRPQ
jgi:putative phosphonate catabolism associated alcohol dehydrogenase